VICLRVAALCLPLVVRPLRGLGALGHFALGLGALGRFAIGLGMLGHFALGLGALGFALGLGALGRFALFFLKNTLPWRAVGCQRDRPDRLHALFGRLHALLFRGTLRRHIPTHRRVARHGGAWAFAAVRRRRLHAIALRGSLACRSIAVHGFE
jgi:hypothetical protein